MIDLKKLRKDHKITQKVLCTFLGMSQPHLSLVENGKLHLSEQRQTLLAERFGDLTPYRRDDAAAPKKAAVTEKKAKKTKSTPGNVSRKTTQDREKQRKFDRAYMRMAAVWAELSHCNRKKVGALIVKDRKIISDGYNGTPTGFENACEDENNQTKWYVLHAEANAILKIAASTQSCEGATLYVTMSPCRECSKLIHQAGIRRVVYRHGYSDTEGLDFLRSAGVEIEQLDEEKE